MGGDNHLVASAAEHRPLVLIAEQPVCRAPHVQHVLGMGSDAAADTKHGLDEQGRLHQSAIEEVRRRVKMTDVVALDFKARVVVAARLQDVGDVLEGVLEDAVIRTGEVRLFPIVFPVRDTRDHFVQAEVHRTHVQRGHFRFQLQCRLQPVLDGHRRRAAGGEVDHHIRGGFDLRQELHEHLWILRRASVLWFARMQVHDRRAGFCRADRRFGDLVRRYRQMRRHRRRMDRAGHCAGNDDFVGHFLTPPV